MLSEEVISKVVARAKELATHSWEYGTLAEALLELESPELSVFCKGGFPNDKNSWKKSQDAEGLKYARQHIRTDGSKTLCEDNTGVADPASLGVSAILLGQHQPEYLVAARLQAEYLLNEAPRYKGKAISHRKDVEEVWADFIYMVPPFLASYALAVNDMKIMEAAVEQCKAYCEALSEKSGGLDQGLWHHIAGPKNADAGYWSTGNGWVAAGLARVLATLSNWSPTQNSWHRFQTPLRVMIRNLIDAVIVTDLHCYEEELLPNYLYEKGEKLWFGDVAGTALLVSVVYRMTELDPDYFNGGNGRYTDWADKKSRAVFKCVDLETGIAKPAVNSLKHLQREPLMTGNPEAQSFIILLWAAVRDYHKVGEE